MSSAAQAAAFARLSPQQRAIVEAAEPPGPSGSRPSSGPIRVTAAAGTGKTTTLESLAVKLHLLGHTSIAYATFNKAAAADAIRRFKELGDFTVDARTIDSFAARALREDEERLWETDSVTHRRTVIYEL
jgi:superfamily I DNA/RNA helicase